MEKKKSLRSKIKSFGDEFKNFALKDATLGAAIGIMLGAALRDVINSLVNDILTPPIAHVTSGIDFSTMYFAFGKEKFDSIEAAMESGAVVIRYGNFINELITFLITAFILFLLVYEITKIVSQFKKTEERKEEKKNKKCPYCKTDIHIKATRCPSCTSKLE